MRSILFFLVVLSWGWGSISCTQGSVNESCSDGIIVDELCLPYHCPNRICPPDFVCLQGSCQEIPCLGVACPSETACSAGRCYPKACEFRNCPGVGELCVDEDCQPMGCAAVNCPEDQRCAAGHCYPINCQQQNCPGYGEICMEGKCMNRSCVGVTCPDNQRCAQGNCYPADCEELGCAGEAEVCVEGNCQRTACVGVDCPGGFACANGWCYPVNCSTQNCSPGEVCFQEQCMAAECVGIVCADQYQCVHGQCYDRNCPETTCQTDEVCSEGSCTKIDCVDVKCTPGNWCQAGQCVPCDTENHCGLDCVDCSTQESNRVCVAGSCGCVDASHCVDGEVCIDGACCRPDCAGKCSGASDGCNDSCTAQCSPGNWCDTASQACKPCPSDNPEHCGAGCLNCASLANNRACVGGACGCRTEFAELDCDSGEQCIDSKCTGCTPDCTGLCGGANDGCDGQCNSDCPLSQWCSGQSCTVCAANDPEHCGSSCQKCSDQPNNQDCIAGLCSCNGAEDCDIGYYCRSSNKLCGVCNTASHCGTTCLDCTASANNRDCIAGACGCNGPEDCDVGYTCGPSNSCRPCDSAQYCGASCQDCTANANDRDCIADVCGCNGPEDCAASYWCNGSSCAACGSSDPSHCGTSCANCAGQANNQDCISGSCGCNGPEDCAASYWCDGASCAACGSSDPSHCGTSCANCAGQTNNRDCISGNCGCNGSEDCAGGYYCGPANGCLACNTAQHCGSSCLDCTQSVNGHTCLSGSCGCTEDFDCDAGSYCGPSNLCVLCDSAEHCGSACSNCTQNEYNKACVSGTCGCSSSFEHCAPGLVCDPSTFSCLDACSQCAAGDSDCDGLPDVRDPWPSVCNIEIYSGGVRGPFPLGDLGAVPSFKPESGTWELDAWLLRQRTYSGNSSVSLLPTAVTDPYYFVETRFTLRESGSPTDWNIGQIIRNDGAGSTFVCELWSNTSYTGGQPTTHIFNSTPSGSSGAWLSTYVSSAAGTVYYMQSWIQSGSSRCRILDQNGNVLLSVSNPNWVPTVTGWVKLRSANRATDFDKFRIHQISP